MFPRATVAAAPTAIPPLLLLLMLLLPPPPPLTSGATAAATVTAALSRTDYEAVAREVRETLQSQTMADEDGKPYHHLVATFLRLALSDCVRERCDGCSSQPHGGGGALTVAIEALEAVRRRSLAATRMSRADLWTLAAMEAINFGVARANIVKGANRRLASIPFRYGRRDCATSPYAVEAMETSPAAVPQRLDPHSTLDGVASAFERLFGLSDRLAVAALGAHVVGTLRRTDAANAAFANWVRCADCFDNSYFVNLANASLDWQQTPVRLGSSAAPLYVWRHGGEGGHRFMFNCDMSLALNFSVVDPATGRAGSCSGYRQCPMSRAVRWVLLYANDYDAWMSDFERAFAAIVERGYNGPNEEALSNLGAPPPAPRDDAAAAARATTNVTSSNTTSN